MFEIITQKNAMNKALSNGIICLAETVKDKNKFAFYTTNFELVHFLSDRQENLDDEYFFDDKELLDEDEENYAVNEHITKAYNVLTNEVEQLRVDTFTGRVFSVGGLKIPDLTTQQHSNDLLELQGCFVTKKGHVATLVSAHDAPYQSLEFKIDKGDRTKVVRTDLFGCTHKGKKIFNDEKVTQINGYLYLSSKQDPQWMSIDKIADINPKGKHIFLPSIGIFKNGMPFSIALLKNKVAGE